MASELYNYNWICLQEICEGLQSTYILFTICYRGHDHVSLDIFSTHLMDQVITLSITGALNAVLSAEHKKEMCRYLYNHQVRIIYTVLKNSLSYLFAIFCKQFITYFRFFVGLYPFIESCT